MKADPVTLATCLLVRDLLSGTLHLTVGVKDKRRHVTEETYEVRAGPTLVLLVKDDGEVYEVRSGGRCTCDDAKYRSRPGGCKHVASVQLAKLLAPVRERQAVAETFATGRA